MLTYAEYLQRKRDILEAGERKRKPRKSSSRYTALDIAREGQKPKAQGGVVLVRKMTEADKARWNSGHRKVHWISEPQTVWVLE